MRKSYNSRGKIFNPSLRDPLLSSEDKKEEKENRSNNRPSSRNVSTPLPICIKEEIEEIESKHQDAPTLPEAQLVLTLRPAARTITNGSEGFQTAGRLTSGGSESLRAASRGTSNDSASSQNTNFNFEGGVPAVRTQSDNSHAITQHNKRLAEAKRIQSTGNVSSTIIDIELMPSAAGGFPPSQSPHDEFKGMLGLVNLKATNPSSPKKDQSFRFSLANPDQSFCSKLEKKRLAVAIISALPFFMNGFMAASKKSPAEIAEVFESSPGFIAFSFGLAVCAYILNVLLTYDYAPLLLKDINKDLQEIIATPGLNKAYPMAKFIATLLPSMLSATASAAIGYDGFDFISSEGAWAFLRWPAIATNAFVSLLITFATRFNGTKAVIARLSNFNNSHIHFQHILASAMKRATQEEQKTIYDLMETSPRSTETKDVDKWIIEHLLTNRDFQEIMLRHKDDKWCDTTSNVARYISATIASITGWLAFGQKCLDGFKLIASSFVNAPLPAKWILFSIAGLPTAALYFTAVLDAFPMLYDSLIRRDTKKFYSFLLTLFVAGSCASMFNVGTNITNNPGRLVPLPPMKSEEWYAYIFPLLVAFLGAFSVNLRSGLKYTTRNRAASIKEELTGEGVLLNIEQSTDFRAALDALENEAKASGNTALWREVSAFKSRLLDPQPYQPTATNSPTLVLMNGHTQRAHSPSPRTTLCTKIHGFFSKKHETTSDYQPLADEPTAQPSSRWSGCLIQ
jgi:hypothetical protein